MMVRTLGEERDACGEPERSGEGREPELAGEPPVGGAPRRIETRAETVDFVR